MPPPRTITRAWPPGLPAWVPAVVAAVGAAAASAGQPAPAPFQDTPADLATRPGEDWPSFLGPTGDGHSGFATSAIPWPAGGPPVVWHCELGEGYCAPAVALGRALVFDRVADENRLRCFHAETGRPLWEARTPTDYVDTFGYDGGPRAAPVVAHGRVLTLGAEGRLDCRALGDGSALWHVDTSAAFHVVRNFFGVGAAPLVVDTAAGPLVIVQVGGSRPDSAPPAPERLDLVEGLDSGLVAFDLATGRERWRATPHLASYATPVRARVAGADRVLAWLRDALVVVDPATGNVHGEFRWRADELFSVVAASPVVRGDEVLLTECYGPGSALVAIDGDGIRMLRRDGRRTRPRESVRAHWSTPVLHEGHVYAASGRNPGDAALVCAEWATGDVRWAADGLGRASLALVAGHLVVLGEFGDLALVRATPDHHDEVSRTRLVDPALGAGRAAELLAPPCWAAPVIARGLCYVRGAGRLVCVDLAGPP